VIVKCHHLFGGYADVYIALILIAESAKKNSNITTYLENRGLKFLMINSLVGQPNSFFSRLNC
jgi:hypothetical protein